MRRIGDSSSGQIIDWDSDTVASLTLDFGLDAVNFFRAAAKTPEK
jgi:hypothetical protein